MERDPGTPGRQRAGGTDAPGASLAGTLDLGHADVLDLLLDAHVAMDATGVVVGWNDAAEKLLGWTREEALGREVAELLVPEEHRADHAAGLARVRATGVSRLSGRRLELAAVDRGGRRFPVELTIQVDPAFQRAGEAAPGRPAFHGFLHDITERRTAARELHVRETFLRAVVDTLDVGVLATGLEGATVLANSTLRRVVAGTGRPPVMPVPIAECAAAYHLHTPDGRLLRPDELPVVRALAGEQVVRQKLLVLPPGRAPVRFLASARLLRDLDGTVIGAVAELRDVTVEHRSRLARSGAAAFAMETGADTTGGPDGADGDALPRALSALAGELGWSWLRWWAGGEDVEPRLQHAWPPASAAGPRDPGLARRAREHADLLWQQEPGGPREVAWPVFSGTTLLGVLEFSDDGWGSPEPELVTLLLTVSAQVARHLEQRRADELDRRLREARARFARVLEQVDDHLWSIELLPGGGVRSHYESPHVTRVLGEGRPDGEVGAQVLERMHPEDRPRFRDYLAAGERGESADVEVRIRGYDDVVRWIWIRGVPRREGERLFVDGISTDVTHRRELDRMKDEFLATVSHELRNPVAVVQGYADLALEDARLVDGPRQMVEVIRRRSAQLVQLVEELFDHARVQAGLVVLDVEPVDLDRLAVETCQGAAAAAAAGGVELSCTGGPGSTGAAGTLTADGTRLRQVLDNVVGNAVKYTPAGGRVEITTGSTDGDVTVRVADTGIGVPPEERERLFEPLFRASTARKHGIDGTGLGLAVSQALVEAHGGRITVEQNPGGGTVVTVRLPRR